MNTEIDTLYFMMSVYLRNCTLWGHRNWTVPGLAIMTGQTIGHSIMVTTSMTILQSTWILTHVLGLR